MVNNSTYLVIFGEEKVAENLSLEQAVRFALDLHSASNVRHTVYVNSELGDSVVTFISSDVTTK